MALNAGTVNQVAKAMLVISLLSKSESRISRIVESTGGHVEIMVGG